MKDSWHLGCGVIGLLMFGCGGVSQAGDGSEVQNVELASLEEAEAAKKSGPCPPDQVVLDASTVSSVNTPDTYAGGTCGDYYSVELRKVPATSRNLTASLSIGGSNLPDGTFDRVGCEQSNVSMIVYSFDSQGRVIPSSARTVRATGFVFELPAMGSAKHWYACLTRVSYQLPSTGSSYRVQVTGTAPLPNGTSFHRVNLSWN